MNNPAPQNETGDATEGKSESLDLSSPETAAIIAAQNDAFRKSMARISPDSDVPKGRVVMTPGVSGMEADHLQALITKVITFDDFNTDSDPYGWHEMGVIKIGGHTVWFKTDLLDENYEYGAPDPRDPKITRRVMTLLFPSEY